MYLKIILIIILKCLNKNDYLILNRASANVLDVDLINFQIVYINAWYFSGKLICHFRKMNRLKGKNTCIFYSWMLTFLNNM